MGLTPAGAGRRDRRGRGLRGPLAPAGMPIALSRSDRFDDLVRDAVERVQERMPELAGAEVVVEDVPPASELRAGEPVPLGRSTPALGHRPATLVVHRRACELRAAHPDDLEDLVRDVVAEQVAALFGLTPEQVDPDYEG